MREAAISNGVNHNEGLDSHWRAIGDSLFRHGISVDWLLYGRGEMRLTDTPSRALPALTHPIVQEGLREVGIVTEQSSYSPSTPPRLKATPGDSAVLVQDGSMDPLIRAGQWVVLSPVPRLVKDGEIAFVMTKSKEAYVRRWRTQDGLILLEHINPDRRYRTVVLKREDVDSARVVVGVFFE